MTSPEKRARHYEHIELLAEVGSWRWEPMTELLWWSPGMHRIFGTDPETFDYRQETLFDMAFEEDRHILTDAAERYAQTGIPERLAYRIRRPDGQIRHVWAFGETLVEPDGTLIARGYILDVTDRVAVETRLRDERDSAIERTDEQLRALITLTPLPAMLHTEDGEIVLVNARWTELSGWDAAEIPTIEAWTTRAYRDRADRARAQIRQLFELTGPVDEGDIELYSKAGDTLTWQFSSAPVGVLADGRRVVVSMALDVTEQRELERERLRYEQQMYEAQRLESLGLLAGGIAHDFNNILTGVLARLSVARERAGEDAPIAALIHDAELAAERAASLARDMLTYAGRRMPDRLAFRLDPAIEELRGLLRTAVSHRHRLVIDLGADTAGVFLGRNELSQIVLNLVTNASEAMREHPGVVTLRTGTQELSEAELGDHLLGERAQAGAFVWLEVEDQGAGISPKVAARLFEPFFSTKSQGRGLGMAVLRGILREAGGVVQIGAGPAAGTRIRLALPLVDAAAEEVEPAPAPSDTPTFGGPVLVIDDEDLVLDATSEMLEILGFEVHAFGDPIDALAHHALAEQDFVLAIVDLTMPRLGGLEVLRELKRRDPKLPVVLMTGYSEEDIPGKDDELRHDVLLIKPFSVREFRAQLNALFGKR